MFNESLNSLKLINIGEENIMPLVIDYMHKNNLNDLHICGMLTPRKYWKKIAMLRNLNISMHNALEVCSLPKQLEKSVLVVEALNQLILQCNWPECVKLINDFKKRNSHIIFIWLNNCKFGTNTIHNQLKYLFPTIISVSTAQAHDRLQANVKNVIKGKYYKNELLVMKNSHNYKYRFQKKSEELYSNITNQAISPHELTTFKIHLETEEKEMRDKIPLTHLPKMEGKVFYQYDAEDDWDDEDPDEEEI